MTNNHKLQKEMGLPYYELGVIAGKCKGMIGRIFFKEGNDGMVAVESTKMPNMTSHIVIRESHNGLLKNKKVFHQVKSFLIKGRFINDDAE